MTVETMRRKYANPPVVEAVARLKFAEPLAWTITTPGLLYERVRDAYPVTPETRNVMRADVSQGGDEGGPTTASLAFSAGPQEMVFLTETRNRLLVIGPEAISAHCLPPYEGWEELESRLFESVERVSDILFPEMKFSETSVRYINQVEIAEEAVDLGEYMTIKFQLPDSFPQQLTGFLDRVEVVYPDAPAKLAFTWASAQPINAHPTFILDLDLSAAPAEVMSREEARATLNDLKTRETMAFEGLIKDRLREQFGELI